MKTNKASKIHVLIIPPWFDVDFTGLFSKMFHHIAQDLSENTNLEVGLIYGDFQWKNKVNQWIEKPALPYHYLGKKSWAPPKFGWMWAIWQHQYHVLFKEYVRKFGMPDIIHGHSILGLATAGYLSKRYHIPVVYTEHLHSLISNSVSNRYLNKAKEYIELSAYNCGVSPLFVAKLESVFKQKFNYVPNYIDTQYFDLPNVQKTEPIFITIGAPVDIKGMDSVIDAFVRVSEVISNAQLWMVDDLSSLKPKVARMGLEGSIRFFGEVDRTTIRSLLHKSTVLVSASIEESFGLTMIEALSCGVPVVATKTVGSQLIVEEGCGKIVSQNSVIALADAMIEVFQNRNQYPAQRLHQNIVDRFDKVAICQQWQEIYSSLLPIK